jgi:hypothetical protein
MWATGAHGHELCLRFRKIFKEYLGLQAWATGNRLVAFLKDDHICPFCGNQWLIHVGINLNFQIKRNVDFIFQTFGSQEDFFSLLHTIWKIVCYFLKYIYLLAKRLVGFIEKLLCNILECRVIFTNSLET